MPKLEPHSMDISIVLTFFFVCGLHSRNLPFSREKISLTTAVEFVVEVFLKKGHPVINLITSDDTFDVKDVVHEMLSTSFAGNNVVVRQEAFISVDVLPGRRRRCLIFVIQDFEDFLRVNSILIRETVWFNGVFLFVFVNGVLQKSKRFSDARSKYSTFS